MMLDLLLYVFKENISKARDGSADDMLPALTQDPSLLTTACNSRAWGSDVSIDMCTYPYRHIFT